MTGIWESWEEEVASPDPDPLRLIAMAARFHGYLSAVETRAVEVARARGASWQDVADAAGTSRQSAWEKWRAVQRLAESASDRFSRAVLDLERRANEEVMAWLREQRSGRAGT